MINNLNKQQRIIVVGKKLGLASVAKLKKETTKSKDK